MSTHVVNPAVLRLPPELDDQIMSMLAGIPHDLRSCTLICRAWLAASRTYLFRDIMVEGEAMCLHLKEVVARSPAIQESISTLNVRIGPKDRSHRWIETALSSILPTQSTHLKVFGILFAFTAWPADSILNMTRFTSVTRLTIDECTFSTKALFSIVCAFPSLKNLEVDAGYIEDAPLQFIHTPILDRLHFSSWHMGLETSHLGGVSLVAFLLNRGCMQSLRVLDIRITMRDAEEVGMLIRTLDPRLEELHIGFGAEYAAKLIGGLIDFTAVLKNTPPRVSALRQCKLSKPGNMEAVGFTESDFALRADLFKWRTKRLGLRLMEATSSFTGRSYREGKLSDVQAIKDYTRWDLSGEYGGEIIEVVRLHQAHSSGSDHAEDTPMPVADSEAGESEEAQEARLKTMREEIHKDLDHYPEDVHNILD
ncbi:hypothetical protein EUX98_g6057 [Antrodiella citrinella]|uniref:F-box domain-containing protein n=1 Tax=Antrodiella citrinella TaxID=2447956 RepID=A0A4S4MSK0_9APHY|nr:hypothetical protein EUX98_g6057 [Antrodiella citrinella]